MSLKELQDILMPVFEKYRKHIIFAYLFGSYAKGELTPLSDIDIAVFLEKGTKHSYFDLKLSIHADFCRVLKRDDVDVIVLNTINNFVLLDAIVREGKILFERDRVLREDFEIKTLHQSIDFKEHRKAIIGA